MIYRLIFLFTLFATSSCHANPIDKMTLEEKIGQILMVHFRGEEANEDAKFLIQTLQIGNIIYYNWANGLHSPTQVERLSRSLQTLAQQNRLAIPLIIATDQEGGTVARLKEGFTLFPSNFVLGMTANPALAEQSAFSMAQEMLAVGVNMNLAPVIDIKSNPDNCLIGSRSFGTSADVVTRFAEKALTGFSQAGLLTTLKHFPGHGDLSIDSHQDLPILNKTKIQLEQLELLPFMQLASQADAIMTGHIMVPAIDPENCATLSQMILNILRNDIGFKGVIITDSLVMEAVLKNCRSIEDAAIRAFNAGCDMIMLAGKQLNGSNQMELTIEEIASVQRAFMSAIVGKRISEQRLNEAVNRILILKQKICPQSTDNK